MLRLGWLALTANDRYSPFVRDDANGPQPPLVDASDAACSFTRPAVRAARSIFEVRVTAMRDFPPDSGAAKLTYARQSNFSTRRGGAAPFSESGPWTGTNWPKSKPVVHCAGCGRRTCGQSRLIRVQRTYPDTVLNVADLVHPCRTARGIEVVFANGTWMWKNRCPVGKTPGCALRRS